MAEGSSKAEIGSAIKPFTNCFDISSTLSEEQSEDASAHIPSQKGNMSRQLTTKTSIDSGTYDQEHENNLDTHCKCPCGNTNFLHCIVPPPECLARRYGNTQGFPEMDITKGKDSDSAKKKMKQHLLDETAKLKDIFTEYGLAVRKFAKSIHGEDSPLYEILRLRYPEKKATIDLTFRTVYEAATDGVDFLNIDPLERVLRECSDTPGNKHSNELLSIAKDAKKKYDDTFKQYAQLRAFSYVDGLRELRPPIPENIYDRLKIKVEDDFAAFTIGRAKKLEEKIRQILGIHQDVCLRLTEVERGCIEIAFEVIGKIDVEIFKLDIEKKKALASNNISMLEYAKKVYYCCCNLFSDNDEMMSTEIKNLYCERNDTFAQVQNSDDSSHSLDCPSIRNKKLKCPVDTCVYCETKLQFCLFQFHMMECDRQKQNLKIQEIEEPPQVNPKAKHEVTAKRTQQTECYGSYQDGLAFKFELPCEDLSLKGVQLEKEKTPVLLFQVAKKVPTITEEDVATCIRLSLDEKRPEIFYTDFLPNHPLAGTGRHYKLYSPSYIRRTSIGETLALVDWHMKCLHVGVRGDKDRGIFQSWAETSNLDGLASKEDFLIDESKHFNVFMKCKDVCVYNTENQLFFTEEPKISIEQECNPGFSNYITSIFDSIAYYDEPIFLKMKEIIKLIVAVEWLRDKEVQFSKTWLQEHVLNSQEVPIGKQLKLELSAAQVDSITKQLQQRVEDAFNNPALEQPSLSVSKCKKSKSFTMTKPLEQVKAGCLEAHFERTFADPFFEKTTGLYVPVVQKQVFRATLNDFDFLYEGMDPNMPVTIDSNTGKLVRPGVNSWSELFGETEPFPCKWLQHPSDPNLRTPALKKGVCTSNIPVRNTPAPVSTPNSNTSTVRVEATKERKKQQVRSKDMPPQAVVNAPPSDVRISSCQSQQNVIARNSSSAKERCGHEDFYFGVSGDGRTIMKQPSLYCSGEITQLIGGKEVGPPFRSLLHLLHLPPQNEPGDSAYSSVANTPQSTNSGQLQQLLGARPEKDDDEMSVDSGVSSASRDTLYSTDSNDTLADDDN